MSQPALLFCDPNDDTAQTPLEHLRGINWDFDDRSRSDPIESLHPYPAKFISLLPREILNCIPVKPGTAVLDPFCGSGTTLVESQRLGIPSVGIDLNPIACLISRVKTSPKPMGARDAVSEVIRRASAMKDDRPPAIPNLDHWFLPAVQSALTRLTASIREFAPQPCQDILRLALSSTIVRVSNQDSDTRYAAVEKSVTADDVFHAFEKAAVRTVNILSQRSYPLCPTDIIEADTLSIDAKQLGRPIGLVITSPPYPNAYEYWLYHKYRMWWLGFDPLAVKEKEIGSRAHFFKKNHHTSGRFHLQMDGVFKTLSEAVIEGGHACIVVGRSRIHGELIDNAKSITEVADSRGFALFFSIERRISSSRKSFNLAHAGITTETLLVFRRTNS
jgi:site-specific DNA-methyltransferase (cytosine-N4-specific)